MTSSAEFTRRKFHRKIHLPGPGRGRRRSHPCGKISTRRLTETVLVQKLFLFYCIFCSDAFGTVEMKIQPSVRVRKMAPASRNDKNLQINESYSVIIGLPRVCKSFSTNSSWLRTIIRIGLVTIRVERRPEYR